MREVGISRLVDSRAEAIVSGYSKSGGLSALFHCALCGCMTRKPLAMYQYPSVLGNRYCSRKCYYGSRLIRRAFRKCAICEKSFSRKPSEALESKYCSRTCFYRGLLKDNVLEWKRDRGRFRKVRIEVLIRDGFQCRRCGVKEVRLEVHHIKSFRKFRELRLDKSNCVTLCQQCHWEIDQWRRQFPVEGKYAADQQVP